MAAKKKVEKASDKMFKITVKGNPGFVGKGAGGVQFANGTAVIPEGRMVKWFKSPEGYEVTAIGAEDDGGDTDDGKSEGTEN